MNFEYAKDVLKDTKEKLGERLDFYNDGSFVDWMYKNNHGFSVGERTKELENNITELQQAISILEKSVILDDLFKDAIVVGEKVAEVSKWKS